jgi:hypothetical protein
MAATWDAMQCPNDKLVKTWALGEAIAIKLFPRHPNLPHIANRALSSWLLWTLLIATIAGTQGITFLPKINADRAFGLAFVSDLISGSAPQNWYVVPHNGFFPDLLIVAAGYWLGFDQALNFVFFTITYHLLLFGSTVFLLRMCDTAMRTSVVVAAMTSLLVAFADQNHSKLALLLAFPTGHNGVLPIVLVVFGLTIREINRPEAQSGAIPACSLTALIVMSDFISIVQIVAPVLFVISVVAWREWHKRALRMIIAVSVGTVAGWAMRCGIELSPQIKHNTMVVLGQVDPLQALTIYVLTFPSLVNGFGLLRIGLGLAGLAAGLVVTARWLVGKNDHAVSLLALGATAALLGPIVAGSYFEPALVFEQIPAYVLPVLLVVWLVATRLPIRRVYLASIAFLLATLLICQFAIAGADGTRSRYLNAQRLVLRALKDVDFVLAEYWDAKLLYLGSDRQLPVCGTLEDGRVYPFETNLGWCTKGLEDWNAQKRWIAIGGRKILPDEVIRNYGRPDRTIRVEYRNDVRTGTLLWIDAEMIVVSWTAINESSSRLERLARRSRRHSKQPASEVT